VIDAHARVESELRERSGALESARDALEQERRRSSEALSQGQARAATSQRIERPLNPALQSRPNWAWRGLALLVIAAVAVAVWLVLHSTILH